MELCVNIIVLVYYSFFGNSISNIVYSHTLIIHYMMYKTSGQVITLPAIICCISYNTLEHRARQDAMQTLGLVSLRVVTLCKQLYVLQLPAYSLTFVEYIENILQ